MNGNGVMYSLLRSLSNRELLGRHLPTATGSLLIAELFYKFGSFSLEAIAFLGTWFVLDTAVQAVQTFVSEPATEANRQ